MIRSCKVVFKATAKAPKLKSFACSFDRTSFAQKSFVNCIFHKQAQQYTNAITTVASIAPQLNKKRFFSTAPATASTELIFGEAIADAQQLGYTEFESLLTAGGDDRSMLKLNTGANKYHCKPKPIESGQIFRGSCTCNVPTDRGYQAAQKLHERLLEKGASDNLLNDVFENQRHRIAKALELPEGVEVVICPSGSDAEYVPIAIARAIQAEPSKILNIVTQLKEIGAGSAPASGGEYFSTHAPLMGKIPDGVTGLEGFEDEYVTEISIPARERDGSVVDASKTATELANKAKADGQYPITHGVFGGKTGMMDGKMPGSENAGETSMGVVDACQGRFALEELHSWLEQDSVVLFTGSKFYQAPPFCGAILIPKRIAEKLKNGPPPTPSTMYGKSGLGGFVTDKELPECMESWKSSLINDNERVTSPTNNVGLALRWEAGLAGMEALSSVPDVERVKAVEEWATTVSNMVQNESQLDPWCVERSIVSIRLKKGEEGWLSMKELREVYRYMSMDLSNADSLPDTATKEERESLSKICFVGQPVDVSETHAILRIALGAESLASYVQDKDQTLQEDECAVKKLAALSSYFSVLQQNSI